MNNQPKPTLNLPKGVDPTAWISEVLGTAGTIGGAILGGPIGAGVGGAAGSALGSALEQQLRDKTIDRDKLLKEAIMSGVTGALFTGGAKAAGFKPTLTTNIKRTPLNQAGFIGKVPKDGLKDNGLIKLVKNAKNFKNPDDYARHISLKNGYKPLEVGDNLIVFKGKGNGMQFGTKNMFEYAKKYSESKATMPEGTSSFASSYLKASEYGKVKPYLINKADIMNKNDYFSLLSQKLGVEPSYPGFYSGYWRRADRFPDLIPEIKKAGYKAFTDTNGEVVVLDKNIVKDIWNLSKSSINSKIVKPATVYYHGTPNPEAIKGGFDLSKAGTTSGSKGVYGKGIYLTNEIDRAKLYGTPVQVPLGKAKIKTIDSSKSLTELFARDTNYGDPDMIAKKYLDQGFDGIRVINKANGSEELAIFNPSVLKIGSKAKGSAVSYSPELIRQASKYQNPEDFINAQGQILYHTTPAKFRKFNPKFQGTNTGDVASNTDQGFFFLDSKKGIEDFKKKLAMGSENFVGNKLNPKDTAAYRTIEKVAKKEDFLNLNMYSMANGEIPVKDAETIASYIGSATGRTYKGDAAVRYIKRVVNDDPFNFNSNFFEDLAGLKQHATKNGYKGFITNYGGGLNEYVVFDPNKLLSKEQLKNIWKESRKTLTPLNEAGFIGAGNSVPVTSRESILRSEARKYNTAQQFVNEQFKATDLPPLKTIKDRNAYIKELGFKDKLDKSFLEEDTWAKTSTPNQYYHIGTEELMNFDKTKSRYVAGIRGGGITQINGMYLGRDPRALGDFYGMIIKDELGERPVLSSFKMAPKWLDLSKTADEDKFLKEVAKKYGVKQGSTKEFGDALEKEVVARGYDGVRYFDPYATGEEFVLVKEPMVQSRLNDIWKSSQTVIKPKSNTLPPPPTGINPTLKGR